MKLTKNPVFLHYFSKFMGILLFVLKYMFISLLLKMIHRFSWSANIMASPFNLTFCCFDKQVYNQACPIGQQRKKENCWSLPNSLPCKHIHIKAVDISSLEGNPRGATPPRFWQIGICFVFLNHILVIWVLHPPLLTKDLHPWSVQLCATFKFICSTGQCSESEVELNPCPIT